MWAQIVCTVIAIALLVLAILLEFVVLLIPGGLAFLVAGVLTLITGRFATHPRPRSIGMQLLMMGVMSFVFFAIVPAEFTWIRGIRCRAVDANFFETAPLRFRFSATVNSRPQRVFQVFRAANLWPTWFTSITDVQWTSNEPYGVGTTRTVTLHNARVYEHFFRWEDNRRFSFYLTSHDALLPLFEALAEDYELEELPNNQTRFTYRVAIEPTIYLRILWPVLGPGMQQTFAQAPQGLETMFR